MTRGEAIFCKMRDELHRRTDRMFVKLLIAQWVFAIVLACIVSPYSYVGSERVLHFHVKAAVVFGGLINALPIVLVYVRPGWWGTRHTIAIVQMLWSALLIMITGGRIETHFHVFGSLAFLAFYRDWKLLPTATVVVAADHLARGLLWPDSVYGTLDPEWWRFLEHAGWVIFEDVVLVYSCLRGVAELRAAATREAQLEETQAATARQVVQRTEELHRYRSLVESTAAIPFELDAISLRNIYVAPQAAELFECSLDELRDEALLWGLVHPQERAEVADAFAAYGRGEIRAGEAIDYRMILRSGRMIYLRTILSGRVAGRIRGVTLDMTKQKHLESELQQAQKLESVGRLAAGIAHEINTPIQFVSDSVQFIRDAVGDVLAANTVDPYNATEVPQALDRAIDGLERVAQIVRSMKVFAHSSGDTTEVDLNRAVESTLVIARNEYKYDADVETDLGELPPAWCHAGEINQVLLNLLLNAAHAIADEVKQTGRRGMIRVRTRIEGNDIVISISDTGPGIPDAIRDRIFDPFFTTKPVGKGTGQGLAIARSVIVDKHFGSLTFESSPGNGTTFHVRLPIHARATEKEAA